MKYKNKVTVTSLKKFGQLILHPLARYEHRRKCIAVKSGMRLREIKLANEVHYED